MEQKSRTRLVIAIAVTILMAAFVSFGLPSLMGVPEVTLPDLNQEETGGPLAVEVTPDTVQSIIATLARPESYYRELTVTLSWAGGSSSDRVQIWADGGYVKTVTTEAGIAQHRLVEGDTLYLWYAGDRTYKQTQPGENPGDLAQHIPTYEDVLALEPTAIQAAGYQTRDGRDCIYLEVTDQALGTLDCYWIETRTGLLAFFETRENDRAVYAMAETSLVTPVEAGTQFALPDGTVLHEASPLVAE